MKITLRKAAQLQAEIERLLATIHINTVELVEVNTAQDPANVLNQQVADFQQQCQRWITLVRISTELRAQIGDTNAQLGITGLLARDAGAKKMQTFLNGLLANRHRTPQIDVWVAKYATELELQRNDVSGYRQNGLNLTLVTQDFEKQTQETLRQLRRERNEISEKILWINTNNHIEVADADWTYLELQGLV